MPLKVWIILGITVLGIVTGIVLLFPNKRPISFIKGSTTTKQNIFYEQIPGSTFHSPDGTWWGYNQSKIVRFKNTVFMYVMENSDADGKTLSKMVIYKKEGDGPWQKGAGLLTSEAGNIVIDSKGVLHAFVFQQTQPAKDLSLGKLIHYWFPNSASGDIKNSKQEIILNNPDDSETVNRVGAGIGPDDTLAVAFGYTTFNPKYQGHSEHLFIKKPGQSWRRLIAGQNLGHDWYYPFVLITPQSYHLLSVQDDFNGVGKQNTYQKVMHFGYEKGAWKRDLLANLTSHPLASKEKRLLEQNDIFLDSAGRVHASYKELLDGTSLGNVTAFQHFTKKASGWDKETTDVQKYSCNWLKFVEVDSTLYYLCASFDRVYIMNEKRTKVQQLAIPTKVQAIYPYLASPRGGSASSEYIDLLLLSGSSQGYATHTDYYVRIPKTLFRTL